MADNAQKVKDIIEKELGVEREKLTDEASFIEDLGADSLDIVELVMEFEKEFDIDIPDEEAEKLRTVGDAIELSAREDREVTRNEASGRRHRNGGVTPVGNDVAATWRRSRRASRAAPITKFDPSTFPVRFACEVKGFDPLAVHRPQGSQARRPVRAVRHRRGGPGDGGRRPRR